MTALLNQIKSAAQKRADYNRTLAALHSMPLVTMIDLDIARNDFDRIARAAVYGN